MMAASNIHYDIADRTRAIAAGGIGAIHLMTQKIGLVQDIDNNLHLLKRHLPYHESDHVSGHRLQQPYWRQSARTPRHPPSG